ncbi:MAG: hypothetical protein IPK81_21750 [Rhodospirillales bacterium]|nr:MAG: hypothetical protein IPK81_21750 [Rhodospirillales bacterium]
MPHRRLYAVRRLAALTAAALLAGCVTAAEEGVPPAGAFNVAGIREDMAAARIPVKDFDRIFTPVPAFYRWAPGDVPVALRFAPGFAASCARTMTARFDAEAARIGRETGLRYIRVADAAKAKVLMEFAGAPTSGPAFRAPAQPTWLETWKNPPAQGPERWEGWQLSDPATKSIVRAYVFHGKPFAKNSNRDARLNVCPADYDFNDWLIRIGWKREDAPLNYGFEQRYDEAGLAAYDRFMLRVLYSEAVKPGTSGRDIAAGLRKALAAK